jgi:hypothetical protein
LLIRDLGFFQLDDLAADARDGRFWLSRLKPRTAVWHNGVRVELPQLLEAQQSEQVELAVELGVKQRIASRLLAVRLPQEVAEQRRRRLAKEARDKGQTVGAELVEHWLLLTGCWQAPERSLPKAAKLVRKAARRLGEALSEPQKLLAELEKLVEKLRRAGRQTRRQKEPNAYRLLLDPSLLVLN